jgi:GNAT superfamily N-acetyltransferase
MRVQFQTATAEDAAALAELHNCVNRHLTAQYGKGPWSGGVTERGVLATMRRANVYVGRVRQGPVATFALSTRKPWAIDVRYFNVSLRPLYLTSMAVAPERQRQGIGKLCIEEARRIAIAWPADAIRLDAFDADAGAGGFYGKCGFREAGRTIYRVAPLIYFEMLL